MEALRALLGGSGGLLGASWGENKGGDKCTRLKNNSCSATSSSTSGFKGPMRTKTIENKTKNIRQLGLGRLSIYSLTRRSSLPSGPGADCLPLAGDTAARPPSFGMSGRHCVAGHLSRAYVELLEVFGLYVQHPQCRLEPLGVSFEALEPS